MAVADGSFMRDINMNLCSTAFVLECAEGRGMITGSFAEFSSAASAFRGELLGLMAIHLLLLALQESTGALSGDIRIYSDCTGSLSQLEWLPLLRIPA